MEWLLILSALLNAATGAFTGTQGPEAPRHEAAVEAVAAAETVAVAILPVAGRTASAPSQWQNANEFPIVADAPLLPAPLETDSLIE